MGVISKETLLGSQDLQTEVVECPEWGGDVIMSELSGADLVSMQEFLTGEGGKMADFFFARIVVRCAVNEQGGRYFDDGELDSVKGKNPRVVKRCAEAAIRLNQMFTGDAKKPEPGTSGDSTTD